MSGAGRPALSETGRIGWMIELFERQAERRQMRRNATLAS
jgi:hypothetical protein